MNNKNGPLPEKRIYLNNYITITILCNIIIFLIALTVVIIEEIKVNPLQNEKQKLHKELEEVYKENKTLTSELSVISKEYKCLLAETKIPILSEPIESATVIGSQINFGWNYTHHNLYQKYFMEIWSLSDCNIGKQKYNVINPEQMRMYIPTDKFDNGVHLWRITPGYLLNDQEIIQGWPSKYGKFTLYASVIDRIQKEKVIRIGTSPTFLGKFNIFNNGDIQGLDIDLIKWIVGKLEIRLNIEGELKVQIIDVPWKDLLLVLQQNELDVVISSMTSSRKREEEFFGIKFTKGYFQLQQIFIQPKKDGKFPDDLKNKTVGVTKNTINEQAANYLSHEFKFKVNNSFNDFAEVSQALYQKKIDFALVDNVLVQDPLKRGKFFQFGGSIAPYLKTFYKEKLGRESEMYAIAVIDESQNNLNLLSEINHILESKECQKELDRLKAKWLQ
ncbi:MAG: transporter substrate-binding domain-containing protein [Deltaproteobacteria bacterium]|nr:transporter substrate-binding domain-containing protein [Deltaproteobacteria bacterium]